MKKLLILALASLVASMAFVACNEDYEEVEETSTCTVVQSFKISDDDSILVNLDTVYFTINLEKGLIYNADSLPYGTDVRKLVPLITAYETFTRADLAVSRYDGVDTVYNYITNSADSIDFTKPVILSVTSPNGEVSMDYTITVNVHKVKTDSLVWDRTSLRTLPSQLSAPTRQHTAATAQAIYCLTEAGGIFSMAKATTPVDDNWSLSTPAMPAGADISTFSATTDALFILADGKLYTSTDDGDSWTDTGETLTNIYGGYISSLIGNIKNADGTYSFVDYPRGPLYGTALPANMPVSGMSAPIAFKFPMGENSQIIMCGGVLPDGKLSADTWGYDGTAWAKLSNHPIATPLKGMAVVPFFTFKENSAFAATEYTVMMAFGGNDGKKNNRTTYLSYDYGISWSTGGDLVQLPEFVAAVYDAQSFVYSEPMSSRTLDAWMPFDTFYRLPATARVVAPITSWECPFIYTFGGINDEGKLSNTIWRATLNRLMFAPLY